MQQKTILITGCSTGIGHDAALALAKRGHRVIASCRKEDDVQKLTALGLEAVRMDMDDTTSIEAAFAEVLAKTGGRLDVLINNAGYGQAGALEDIPRAALRSQFETNVFGLLDLTRLAIPLMRKQGQGRIINISSILGVISLPFRGAYNASKYAVEGLSDTLRLELQSSGIRVITVEPGPIESRFRDSSIDNSLQKIDKEHS
ncbi:TPA: SDR family NAD(P)-dependent oxidoreductase, partial [Legionella feeleii]